MDGLGALGLAEVDVGFAANFGAVSQDAGNDLHLQLLCKQQTRAGMAQHMAAAGWQIQGRSLQQIASRFSIWRGVAGFRLAVETT